MSDDNLTNDDSDNSPKALREALEKANRKVAEFEKREAERAEAERRQSLTSILKAKGLKESAAAHYNGDVSEEAVVKWASDLGLLGEEATKDPNAEAAARAAALSGSSQSLPPVSPASGGPVVGDPYKALELIQSDGFSYELGVQLGIFPKDPNTI